MERLNKRFPNVLFEGCAGGGGRFDLGILSYQPQIWSSDNMDGWDRLLIQYGTSFCYPALTQGSHIGSSPNQITRRESPLKWRALLAMSANLGVEADISKWSEGDRKELAGYVSLYKEIRPLVQFGDFHRLEDPYDFARTAWMFTSRDQKEALLFIFQSTPPQGPGLKPVCLRGLDPSLLYQIKGEGAAFTGEHLMSEGWLPKEFQTGRVPTPFHAALYRLQAGN
jgi:alpha-galactosidase